MGWEDAAEEWNAMGSDRRRETMRAVLADLCAGAWFDLYWAVLDEAEERRNNGRAG